jgi:hypothetical protein
VEYQRIGAWRQPPAASTDSPSLRKRGVLERGPVGGCRVVFGTLLGPEATGPWRGRAPFLWGGGGGVGLVFLVSWLHRSCAFRAFAGRVCGVCGTGLLFENYIVDASIFYKKQFPRI